MPTFQVVRHTFPDNDGCKFCAHKNTSEHIIHLLSAQVEREEQATGEDSIARKREKKKQREGMKDDNARNTACRLQQLPKKSSARYVIGPRRRPPLTRHELLNLISQALTISGNSSLHEDDPSCGITTFSPLLDEERF